MNLMHGLGALTWAYLIQSARSKAALFWNLALPLIFLVGLSFVFGGGESERVGWIVPGILTINLLSASLFGLALPMVSMRERGVYRRLRATPVTAMTVVTAHAVTAAVNIMLAAALQLLVGRLAFGVEIRGSLVALAAALLLSAFALLPLGLLVGGAARDMKTAPMVSNLLFFPMMFLSGAAMPLFLMPGWIQKLAVALPPTYVVELLQGIIVRGEGLGDQVIPVVILGLTAVLGVPLAASAFRWESDGPLHYRRLVLAIACLAVVYGTALLWGVRLVSSEAPEEVSEPFTSTSAAGEHRRVLTGVTVLDGLGGRIERARVVFEGDRIVEVGRQPARGRDAGAITNYTGKFLIPGLIDSHVHLGGSGGGAATSEEFTAARLRRDLQVYLASGVTTIVSMTDDLGDMKSLQEAVVAGTMRGPRTYFSGPGLTAPSGHPAVYFASVPGLANRITRQVETADEAIAAVQALADHGVSLIKFYLDAGRIGESLPVLQEEPLFAAMRAARERGLATTVHVDSDAHARLALRAGASALEHVPPDLSAETIASMAATGVTLTPTLVASESLTRAVRGDTFANEVTWRWVQPDVLISLQSPRSWVNRVRKMPGAVEYYAQRHQQSLDAVRRAILGGVSVVAGSDAGNPGAFHGLSLIRELELLVDEGGMTPLAALKSATGTASARLKNPRIGRIEPGAFADFVILGRDPTADIRALREIEAVYLRGERVDLETLLTLSPGPWMPRAGIEAK